MQSVTMHSKIILKEGRVARPSLRSGLRSTGLAVSLLSKREMAESGANSPVSPPAQAGEPCLVRLGRMLGLVGVTKAHRRVALVLYASYLLVLASLPVIIYELVHKNSERHIVVWFIAGLFVLLAVPLSFHDAFAHMLHYQNPNLQRYCIRIIFMVPIYAIESWFALRFRKRAQYWETLRECYEAYAIYSFYKLMESYLEGEGVIPGKMLERVGQHCHHMFPFKYVLPKWELSKQFVHKCRKGVFQYVFIKVALTIITLILVEEDKYMNGDLSPKYGFLYVVVITNVSQIAAMYCLVLFYHTLVRELDGLHPLPKLLCIKAVVFFTFWQNMIIAILSHFEVIKETLTYSQEEVSSGLSNFLVCIEMFIAALAHHKYYGYRDYYSDAGDNAGFGRAARDLFPFDMAKDVKRLVRGPSVVSRGVGITSGSTGDQAALSSDAQPGEVNADALVPLGPGEVKDSLDSVEEGKAGRPTGTESQVVQVRPFHSNEKSPTLTAPLAAQSSLRAASASGGPVTAAAVGVVYRSGATPQFLQERPAASSHGASEGK